jgi:eukaryotic-like serine/threonine-protein kinase
LGDLNATASAQSSQRLIARAAGVVYAPSADPAQGRILFLREGTLMAQTWDVKNSSLLGDPVPVAEQVSTYRNVFGRFSVSGNGTLVYRTGVGNSSQLTWMDREGKALGTVGEPDRYFVVVLNRDGTKAGLGRVDASGKNDLWALDLPQGTSTRLTSDPGRVQNIAFSPDGSRFAFASTRGPDIGFYQKASSGAGDAEVLLSSGASASLTEWTRDGRFLMFAKATPETGFDLWMLPLQGDHKPFPFLRTQFNEVGARVSPDGRWIAYLSDETGKNEIYVKRFVAEPDGGASAAAGKWLISRSGGNGMIHWRNDGKELYYLAPGGKMMAVEVSVTSSGFHTGDPKALFSIPEAFVRSSPTPGNLGDITPDGKRFLFALPVQQTDEFTVILNWETVLKK